MMKALRTRKIKLAAYTVGIALSIGLLAGAYGFGGVLKEKQANAQLAVEVILDTARTLEFVEVEAQEISVDVIRKVVIEQITKKVIEKVIYGDDGGVSGGALGSSNGGAGAFINDYSAYMFEDPANDTRDYIDVAYSKYFPSYTNPAIKSTVKNRFDPNRDLVPRNCVNVASIDFENDPNAVTRFLFALQDGCNEASAQAILQSLANRKYAELMYAAQTEAIANSGLVSKDEDNKLTESGVVYEGVVQGALAAVYNVQTNNKSAISSIIGAFLDQILDELLSGNAN